MDPTRYKSTEFTSRVASHLLSENASLSSVSIRLQGPFGLPVNVTESDGLIVLVGGTGLPAGLAVAWEAVRAGKKVFFAWGVRGEASKGVSVIQGIYTYI